MGGGTYNPSAFSSYTRTASTQSVHQNFTQSSLLDEMNPAKIKVREARDNADHPESNAIIICFDETGSMGEWANYMAGTGLPKIAEQILDPTRSIIKDPQVMFMAQGDGRCDSYPVQAGQFESDIRMTDWLKKLVMEGNGGGNGGESYWMAYYMAAYKTSMDCWEQRKRKGYVFTIGDEPPHLTATKGELKRFFGVNAESDMSFEDILTEAKKTFNCYHVFLDLGSYNHSIPTWKKLFGENLLVLRDPKDIAELIVSTIEVMNGATLAQTTKKWSGSTAVAVQSALSGLVAANNGQALATGTSGIRRL